MITLDNTTLDLIVQELEGIPAKYQKPFNSGHEGYAVLLEEVEELKDEIFFGEKKHKAQFPTAPATANAAHRGAIRAEAVQVAAMAVRIIQELT